MDTITLKEKTESVYNPAQYDVWENGFHIGAVRQVDGDLIGDTKFAVSALFDQTLVNRTQLALSQHIGE